MKIIANMMSRISSVETATSIKTCGRPVLEKNYRATTVKEMYGARFFIIASVFFVDTAQRTACDRGPCASRALSMGHRYLKTAIAKVDLAPSLLDVVQCIRM